jgi:hypothetical protein
LPYDWFLAWGSLPPGIFLSISGELGTNGGPTTPGAYGFVLGVTDGGDRVATRGFTITVNRLQITSPFSLPAGTAGVAYPEYQLTASGGSGPFTWTVPPGTLPPGLSLSASGLVSGTVVTPGTYFFSATVTDSSGQSASQSFSVQFSLP